MLMDGIKIMVQVYEQGIVDLVTAPEEDIRNEAVDKNV